MRHANGNEFGAEQGSSSLNSLKCQMANNTTTFRLDMSSAPGVWTSGPAFTQG